MEFKTEFLIISTLIKIMTKKMDTVVTKGDEAGNTDKPRPPQRVYWTFTLNNYDEVTMETLETLLKHECDWFVFQEEIGESGTPHLQGTLKLKTKQRLSQMKCIDGKAHWEPTRAVKASIAYCTKKETRAGRQIVYGIEIPEEVNVDEPYGWQEVAMDIIRKKPDGRTIYWFWEDVGGFGKSTFAKYLACKHNALLLSGKSNDMFHMLSRFPSKRKLIVVDVPRCQSGFINYGAIEMIKNGLVFSGKYEGSQLVFNPPHVFVFANTPPDFEMMSRDRWIVTNLRDATTPVSAEHVAGGEDATTEFLDAICG